MLPPIPFLRTLPVPPSACVAVAALLLAACGGGSSSPLPSSSLELKVVESGFEVSDGRSRLRLGMDGRMRWETAEATLLLADLGGERAPSEPNPDYDEFNDIEQGIDRAYPGLPDQTYRPLAYLSAAGWQQLTRLRDPRVTEDAVSFDAETSDGHGALLRYRFAADGALELLFRPNAPEIQAVSTAWSSPVDQRYFGGGQRFSGFELRGSSLPLWISHGPRSNRATSTNEIAASFFWCPCGWGAWAPSDARGEINFAEPAEHDDAVRLMQEDEALEIVLYRGTPREILSAHTARAGRPQWTPPDWMWRPMVWQDSDTSTESVRQLVHGMKDRGIPLGAVWLDNPWDAGKASHDFDPARFEDPDALIREVHELGVRFMVWLSPFVTGEYEQQASERGWRVTGTRPDDNDATYYPVRGIDPHLDFTHPQAVAWWQDRLRALIRRGVDGFKVDRGEEDLSEDSVWHNGLPNRLNHNAYVDRYQRAIFEALQAERPDGDFAIFSRGGWNGSARWTGHWAADNGSFFGELGLTQALRSLLSLSASGFPFSGSDIGGYAGLRQDAGEGVGGIPVLTPGEPLYIRWTQLGAFSPSMQTPVPPWWVNERTAQIYRRYATLHDRLVPYIAAAARESVQHGVPIVRPMPYEYPDDPLALEALDQYLFGPDLLVAPVTTLLEGGLIAGTRLVYIPPGRWKNFWTGNVQEGPRRIPVLVGLDQIPLFVRDGAQLPPGVSAGELP